MLGMGIEAQAIMGDRVSRPFREGFKAFHEALGVGTDAGERMDAVDNTKSVQQGAGRLHRTSGYVSPASKGSARIGKSHRPTMV